MKKQNGFTLIELLTVVAILSVILVVTAPSFGGSIAQHRLTSAAETALGQFYAAKSEALRTGQSVYFSVNVGPSACYGFRANQPCDCTSTGTNKCTLSQTSVSGSDGVTLQSTTILAGTGFIEPVRGTVASSGTLSFRNVKGQVLSVGVSRIGRPFTCSPSDGTHVVGYSSVGC